jgi:hypothetical protein
VDASTIASLLRGDGWGLAPFDGDGRGTGYERGWLHLVLTQLVRSSDGRTAILLWTGPVALLCSPEHGKL